MANIEFFFTAVYLFKNTKIMKSQKFKKILIKINLFSNNKYTLKKISLKFNEIFEKMNLSYKDNVLIYCAFDCSFPILKFIKKKKIEVKTIFDSNKNRENSYFEKIKISHYSKLNNFISDTKKNIILITHPEKKTYLIIKKDIHLISKYSIETKHIGFKNIFKF